MFVILSTKSQETMNAQNKHGYYVTTSKWPEILWNLLMIPWIKILILNVQDTKFHHLKKNLWIKFKSLESTYHQDFWFGAFILICSFPNWWFLSIKLAVFICFVVLKAISFKKWSCSFSWLNTTGVLFQSRHDANYWHFSSKI